MNELSADPESVAAAGQRILAVNDSLEALARRARDLADIPMRQHFPNAPEGQQLAAYWDQARGQVADGLRLATTALQRLGSGLQQAAAGFARADTAAGAPMSTGTDSTTTVNLPL